MKDCINPAAYWQCISLNQGKCLHPGPCEPIDHEGNRYNMAAFKEEGKTLCYIRVPYNERAIIDADILQENKFMKDVADRIARIKARQKTHRPVIIAEEAIPSPHPWLDPLMDRAKFENEAVKKICGACPECGECTISKEPAALYRCRKLEKVLSKC